MTFSALLAPSRRRRAAAFLLPALVSAAPALAQQPAAKPSNTPDIRLAPEDQDRGLNGVQKNFWFRTDESGEYKNAGFFGQRLRPYLTDQEAISNLDAYRRQRWLHLSERLVFVGAAGVYAQQVLATDKPQYFSNVQKAAIGVAVVSLLSNTFITRHTNQHFMRAVEAQNATLPAARRMGLDRVKPDLLGVTAPTGRPQLLVGWTLR
ncbi:hypothetical protein EJV47_00470 [Hymenobacter gummosus]|uniref:DUF5683 domain-containing protein n=1 Tax=Hymenobacter gummosus TaxID=1776032 RepID=A0A3S0JD89_9BACT|nr:hypothetical protein [Hymenobacter gummosus]RTQ53249.1 hypothetical protein EJV47_00470 [Hymenobacter gummosus]